MCGRFLLEIPEKISSRFGIEELDFDLKQMYPSDNIRPTQQVPIITRNKLGKNKLELMQWGIIADWQMAQNGGYKKPIINARAETLYEKPTFKDLVITKRCLIPATGFYESQHLEKSSIPFRIKLKDQELFAMAGLWSYLPQQTNEYPQSKTFTIITTNATDGRLKMIHDRMPVILSPEEEALWLDPSIKTSTLEKLTPLMNSYSDAQLLIDSVKTSPIHQAKFLI